MPLPPMTLRTPFALLTDSTPAPPPAGISTSSVPRNLKVLSSFSSAPLTVRSWISTFSPASSFEESNSIVPVAPSFAAIVVFFFVPGQNSLDETGGMPPISTSSLLSSDFLPVEREEDAVEVRLFRKPESSAAMSSGERCSGWPKVSSAVRFPQSTSKDWRRSPSHMSPSVGSDSPRRMVMRSWRSSPDRSSRIAWASPLGTVSPDVDSLDTVHVYFFVLAFVVTKNIVRSMSSSSSVCDRIVALQVNFSVRQRSPAASSSPADDAEMRG